MKTEITNNRIDILDYLRGFALIGILLVNVPFFLLKVDSPLPNSIDASYQRFLYFFVEGRFMPIFTFLFGIGFYIFITRAKAKNYNPYLLFIRRLVVLFAISWILERFDHGEALIAYAIFGIFLIPFYRVNKHINLILALVGLMCTSYLGDKVLSIIPLFLLGLTAGQYRIFETISDNKWKFKVFTIIAFVLSIIGLWIQYTHVPSTIVDMPTKEAIDSKTFMKIGTAIGPIVSASYVGILILLLQYSWVQKLLSPLKYYGRMALTNYLSQAALVMIFDYYFQLTGNITYSQTLVLCIGIYVIQLPLSMMWLQFFRMGPFEWLWRMGTYWKVAPNKK